MRVTGTEEQCRIDVETGEGMVDEAEEEIGRLTQDELRLFLKLCKDPSVAQQLVSSSRGCGDTMTSSTVTSSETSSQDNSYMPAPQVAVSVASPA